MEPLLKWLAQEGRVILQAPISIAVFLAIVGGLIWWALSWQYSSRIDSLNAQIQLLNSRLSAKDEQIAEYRNKLKVTTPDQAMGEMQSLRDQLAETRRQLAEIKRPPREENALYRRGRKIGTVAGPKVDRSSKSVQFQIATVSESLDDALNVEFGDLQLSYIGGSTAMGLQKSGLAATFTYHWPKFTIVGDRTD